MRKKNLQLVSAYYFYPFITRLKEQHLSEDYVFNKSMIKNFNVKDSATYLPVPVLYEYLQTLKKNLDLSSVAVKFQTDFNLEDLGDYGVFLSQCPELYTVILEGINNDCSFQINSKMLLEINGSSSRIYLYHIDEDSTGKYISEEITFAKIINAFRMVLGPNWSPMSIVSNNISERLLNLIPDTLGAIEFNSKHQSITFETKDLDQLNNCIHKNANKRFLDLSLCSFTLKINMILNSLNPGFIPSISFFSKIFAVSERTIVRNLAMEKTTYSSILQQHLFKLTIQLMHDKHMKINKISQYLGYSNSANFVRAFKNWTKVTPTVYRYGLH